MSNIAWDLPEEAAAAGLLAEAGIDRVDLAPGKYFPDPAAASDAEIARVRHWWENRGFTIEGMQGLLFGTTGLNLFADAQDTMLDRLDAVCRIAAGLGARALTFGSPRQRDRGGLDDTGTDRIASSFFARLGDRAEARGVIVCLEPAPVMYGGNFLVGTADTADFVARLGHPAIMLQLDVGALAANGEAVDATIAAVAPLIGHVHASEPGLVPLGDAAADHAAAAAALRRAVPDHTVTIEMARPSGEDPLAALVRAVALARTTYGSA